MEAEKLLENLTKALSVSIEDSDQFRAIVPVDSINEELEAAWSYFKAKKRAHDGGEMMLLLYKSRPSLQKLPPHDERLLLKAYRALDTPDGEERQVLIDEVVAEIGGA